jgi:predicted  nucleic acid-binding Zn-ribbon protein
MTARVRCAECGTRYDPVAFRVGAACPLPGCSGRIGFPKHITEQIENALAYARARAASLDQQADAIDDKPRTVAWLRGAAAAFRYMDLDLTHALGGGWPLDGNNPARLNVPAESTPDEKADRFNRALAVMVGFRRRRDEAIDRMEDMRVRGAKLDAEDLAFEIAASCAAEEEGAAWKEIEAAMCDLYATARYENARTRKKAAR